MAELKRTDLSVRAERAVLMQAFRSERRQLAQVSMEELRSLAGAARAYVVGEISQPRLRPDGATYLGRGKVQELKALCHRVEADIVICDDDLTPAQVSNLESALDTKVVDRSELILDIFAQHARTRQAKLQVELAQLEYAFPRLKKMWSHLDRVAGGAVAGGIGVRGPGEKQLEVDRRLVQKKIYDLKKELEKIERRRERMVQGRAEQFTTLALVGYTNAGKSSLMNALTGAGVSVRDRLFETLDTRTRQWTLPGGKPVMISDTIGFVRKLPHHLVASFHATLQEAHDADLLLHVADAANPTAEAQIDAVRLVLDEIGCGEKPCLLVLNKIDAVPDALVLPLLRQKAQQAVCVSAHTGEGLPELSGLAQRFVDLTQVEFTVEAGVGNGKLFALLYEKGQVLEHTYHDDVARLRVRAPQGLAGVIESMGGRARAVASLDA